MGLASPRMGETRLPETPGARASAGPPVRSHAVPRLVDTTIRVLCQEPLAGLMPTADLFDSPSSSTARVSPTSRSRAAASSTRPCAAASRARGSASARSRRARRRRSRSRFAGRFLVGSRPVGGDFARRFVASAAESGIDVFRLHDPLNDVDNLREAAEAIVAAGASSRPGCSTAAAGTRRSSRRPSGCPSSAPRASCCTTRPRCCSRTARASSSPSCARSPACRSASTARARAATRSPPRSRRRAPAPT